MVSAPKNWRRWCGPRRELVRATELASDEIRASTGVPAEIDVEVEEKSGLTNRSPDTTPITSLHPSQLQHVARVAITVTWDHDAWWETRKATKEGDEPPARPQDRVRIRVTKYGTTLDVEGDDRTRVEGARVRLAEVLERGGATNSPGFHRLWFFSLAGLLAFPGTLAGVAVAQLLGLASSNDRWELAEIAAIVLGAILAYVPGGCAAWLFPPIELFEDGSVGRARRFRKWIIGIVGGLILAVVAGFIYDGVK